MFLLGAVFSGGGGEGKVREKEFHSLRIPRILQTSALKNTTLRSILNIIKIIFFFPFTIHV